MVKNALLSAAAVGVLFSKLALADGLPLYKCNEPFPSGRYKVTVLVKQMAFNPPRLKAKIFHEDTQTGRSAFTTAVGNCQIGYFGSGSLYCSEEFARNGQIFEREIKIYSDGSGKYEGSRSNRDLKCAQVGYSHD